MVRIIISVLILFFSLSNSYSQTFKEYVEKGDSCFLVRDLAHSLNFYNKALNLKPERLITELDEVTIFKKIGTVYTELTEYQSALEFYFKFLDKDVVKSNDSLLSIVYNKIGVNYDYIKQPKQALKFLEKSLETVGSDPKALGTAYNNLADIYLKQNKYNLAKEYFIKALKLFKEAEAYDGLIVTNINLGTIEQHDNKIETAQHYFLNAESIAEKNKDTIFLIASRVYLADFYIKITDFDKAREKLDWSLQTAIAKNSPQYIKESYEKFVNLYEKKKDYENAFLYLQKFKASSDSILNLNSSREYAELEAKYSIQEKEQENEILKKEQLYVQTKMKSQELYNWGLSFLVILTLLFLTYLYLQRSKRTKVRKQLEAQNKEIRKSKKQMEDLNRQYEKLIEKYEGGDSVNRPTVEIS